MAETLSDPVLSLENDHEAIALLFREFDSAPPEDRTQILQNLVRELSIHAAVEEKVVYPLVREVLPEGAQLADASEEDHQRMKEILADLDGADGSDPEVEAKVGALRDDFMAHVEEEQVEVLQQLRWTLPPAEFTELGEKVSEARESAPTRPHPNASVGGVSEKVAAAVDRARDSLRGDSTEDDNTAARS